MPPQQPTPTPGPLPDPVPPVPQPMPPTPTPPQPGGPLPGQPQVAPLPPTPTNMPVSANSQQLKSGRSIVKKILAGAGGLVTVLVVAGILLSASGDKPIKFSAADLQSENAGSYTFSHPKQWTDYTNDPDAKKNFEKEFGDTGGQKDVRVYGYKYDAKTDTGMNLLFTGAVALESGLTDAEFKEALKDPEVKAEMEKSLSGFTDGLDDDTADCEKTDVSKPVIDYSDTNYIFVISATAECTYNDSGKAKYSTSGYHQILVGKIKNDTVFIATLVSANNDWELNSSFYEKELMAAFKAN